MKSVGAWVKRHPIWSGLILLVVALITYQALKPKTYDYVYVSETVTRGEVVRKVTASGKLRALNTIKVGAEVSGQVSRVAVDFNTPVKAGQVLAEIDPPASVPGSSRPARRSRRPRPRWRPPMRRPDARRVMSAFRAGSMIGASSSPVAASRRRLRSTPPAGRSPPPKRHAGAAPPRSPPQGRRSSRPAPNCRRRCSTCRGPGSSHPPLAW